MTINALKAFLLRQAERYGRPVLWLYALLFLLLMSGLLAAVYLLFGALMVASPDAVLVVTALLVALILYANRRKP